MFAHVASGQWGNAICVEALQAGAFAFEREATAVPGAGRVASWGWENDRESSLDVAPENPLPFSDLKWDL